MVNSRMGATSVFGLPSINANNLSFTLANNHLINSIPVIITKASLSFACAFFTTM